MSSAIVLPPIYYPTAPISVPSKLSSAIPTSPPPKSIPTSPTNSSAMCIKIFTAKGGNEKTSQTVLSHYFFRNFRNFFNEKVFHLFPADVKIDFWVGIAFCVFKIDQTF